MSVEENKAIARRWNEQVWNDGDLAVIDELADDSYVNHTDESSSEGYKQYVKSARAAFSEIRLTIEDMIAEGDKVMIRWSMQGRHTGEYLGMPGTGKQGTMTGMSLYRIAGGKIVEDWSNTDALGFMQQLGVIPPMG